MCWEDLTIARNTWSQTKVAVGGASVAPVVPMNNARIGLVFGPTNTGSTRVAPDSPDLTIVQGYLLSTSLPGCLAFNIYDHGDIVRRPWWGIASAANTYQVTEIFAPLEKSELKEYDNAGRDSS